MKTHSGMNMPRLVLLPLLLLTACGIDQEGVGEKAGEAWCKRSLKCGDLAENDEQACIDNIAAGVDLVVNLGESFGDEYDPAGAGACVREVRGLSCDEMEGWSSEDCSLFVED